MGKNKNPNRENAIATGDNFYEGRPCIKCGSTRKYVRKSQCVNCRIEQRKKFNKSEVGKKLAAKATQKWKNNNKTKFRKYMSSYYASRRKRTRLATPPWLKKIRIGCYRKILQKQARWLSRGPHNTIEWKVGLRPACSL